MNLQIVLITFHNTKIASICHAAKLSTIEIIIIRKRTEENKTERGRPEEITESQGKREQS